MGAITERKNLGSLLVEKRHITQDQLNSAIETQNVTGKKLGEVLIKLGFVDEETITRTLSEQQCIPYAKIADFDITPELLALIPEDVARAHQIFPLIKSGNTLSVAMNNPLDVFLLDKLRFMTKCSIRNMFASATDIRTAIDQYYSKPPEAAAESSAAAPETARSAAGSAARKPAENSPTSSGRPAAGMADIEEITAPAVSYVEALIRRAVTTGVSDIHLEPAQDKPRVRFRIDGVLQETEPPARDLYSSVVSRIKILSEINIAEKRLPQDGRFLFNVNGKEIDFRVSTFPTIYGEKIVIRVLDKGGIVFDLDHLGFSERMLELLRSLIVKPNGIILVTGPTGSGKTTTLYSILQKISDVQKNVITLENPVEYRLEGIIQSQINEKTGLTFPVGLRSVVRQDPDVIMIGEIRDFDTADIAIHSALTGHLVLSTLHTNDAPSTFSRMVDMGIEPFLIASSVIGVLAQRLVRVLCTQCREAYPATKAETEWLGMTGRSVTLYRRKGCPACSNTGYKGRMGVYELLVSDDVIKEMIVEKAFASKVKAQARSTGMTTLREDAVAKMLSGITSIEEVLRVTPEDREMRG